MNLSIVIRSFLILLMATSIGWAQEPDTAPVEQDIPGKLKEHAEEVSKTLNESETIKEVSSGILEPIYQVADFMSFPTFYWVAFALMVAGVISFAFQLVIGKFFLLFKFSLNIKEILSDFLGLLISVVGLVLTTQAATQNSEFPQNATAVVSATAVGLVLGLVFFWWGQSLEHKAARPDVKEKE